MFDLIKNILAPIKCYSCKKEGHFICNDCKFKLRLYRSSCYICKEESENFEIHKHCKNKKMYFDKAIILYHYKSHFVSMMIKQGKYYHKKDVLKELGSDLAKVLLENIKAGEDYIMLPVPLHWSRLLTRGYNQSEVLSESVFKASGIVYNTSIVRRKKVTRQQSKLSKNKRTENIKNSFVINKKYVDNIDKKRIIIVDDVISTGNTANELAKTFKELGAKEIIILCVASN